MEDTQNPYAAPTAPLPVELGESVKADRGIRLVARLIDGGLQLAVLVPMIVVLVLAGPNSGGAGSADQLNGIQIAALALSGLMTLALVIYQFVLLYQTSQTLGKRWMGIKIVRNDGSSCSFGRILGLRMFVTGLIEQVPCIGMVFALANVLWIFGEESRCLHDLLADTKVVNV
ncbi:RDD family protein [Lysobacter sp. CA199]|uniref:RDD family protein n=1 Tax=Lysobacter sp. CA199 TaxID=3455608 RepID=UPI003F8D78DE